MANINSFAENMRQTVINQSNTLSLLTGIQKSIISDSAYVTYGVTNKNGDTSTYQIPSYVSIVNRLNAVENSINSLLQGKGTVSFKNGDTIREVKLTSLPETPSTILVNNNPTTFNVDANWFFEDLLYPSVTVNVDLTDTIDPMSKQVRVKRIILDSTNTRVSNLWINDVNGTTYSYQQLISLLQENNVSYREDEETLDFPLVYQEHVGTFYIVEDPIVEDGYLWYQLNTLNYNTVDSDGNILTDSNILSVGDRLSYQGTLVEIEGVNQNKNSIRIKFISGVNSPGINSVLSFYEDPTSEKIIRIRFGANEYDIVYFKGINDNYKLMSTNWSSPITFDTNTLVNADNNQQTFQEYYLNNISDFGAKWIAEAKEKSITAYYGTKPNAPTLSVNDFRVVQINTQINAELDNSDVKQTISDIETVKSEIQTLKSTIAAQKTYLQSTTEESAYNNLQKQIETNTKSLETAQISYSSLIKNLQNVVKENSAVTENPKYHIRGFFAIPELQYQDDDRTISEDIIGFDIAYRYIKQDNSGAELNTFTFTNGSTNETGVFSDWNYKQSVLKERRYNEDTDTYDWVAEDVTSGTEININQIDIAITKGEKVEFMVRSISEAGYPNNCLKSDWSNSIIIEFPSTLSTTNEIADLITEINDDAVNLSIDNTLNSLGVTSHLSDTTPNTNSNSGLYFKHVADNIAYEKSITNASTGATTISTISVQSIIDEMRNTILDLQQQIIELKTPTNSSTAS